MAKGGNKNATKSFVMLIVTGVVLVAVTLCWFAINRNSFIEGIDRSVGNKAQTKAELLIGVDSNGKIADRHEAVKKYVSAETDEKGTIVLENMVPGAEYFYMAEFENKSGDYIIELSMSGVENKGLAEKITVYSRYTNSAGAPIHTNSDSDEAVGKKLTDLPTYIPEEPSDEGKIIKQSIKDKGSTHRVYFSFRFEGKNTGNEYGNKSVKIGNVSVTLSSPTTETTTTSSVTE